MVGAHTLRHVFGVGQMYWQQMFLLEVLEGQISSHLY